jgi:hypothetical protein
MNSGRVPRMLLQLESPGSIPELGALEAWFFEDDGTLHLLTVSLTPAACCCGEMHAWFVVYGGVMRCTACHEAFLMLRKEVEGAS